MTYTCIYTHPAAPPSKKFMPRGMEPAGTLRFGAAATILREFSADDISALGTFNGNKQR